MWWNQIVSRFLLALIFLVRFISKQFFFRFIKILWLTNFDALSIIITQIWTWVPYRLRRLVIRLRLSLNCFVYLLNLYLRAFWIKSFVTYLLTITIGLKSFSFLCIFFWIFLIQPNSFQTKRCFGLVYVHIFYVRK